MKSFWRTNPDDPKKNLAEVKSEWYFEVGNAQHRLHVDGALKLKHTGNYLMSNEKIRGVVECSARRYISTQVETQKRRGSNI